MQGLRVNPGAGQESAVLLTGSRRKTRLGRVLMRLTSTILWSLIVVGAMGCEAQREADLLEVSAVEPARISPERTLRVRGAGFPPGRDAILRFEGTMRRPGAAPTEVSVELTGRAVAAEQIEARFTPEALEQLGGRGTLHGRVIAIFEAAEGRGRVIGRSPELDLDIVSSTTERLHGQLVRRRAAAALLDDLGLSLADESPDAEGLPITLVQGGSIAEHAGLLAGDRLIAAEGVRAHDPSDVLPGPGLDTITLRLARPGEAAPFVVVLPTGVTASHDVSAKSVRAGLIALGWALLVLVLLAPSAGLADWIASAARVGTPTTRTRGAAALWRRHRGDVPPAAVGLLGLASLPALDRTLALNIKLDALLLGLLALRVGAAWLGTASRPVRTRLLALVGAAASVLAVGVGLGAIAALGGTTDLSALSVQSAAPWEWTLLRTPVAVPALGLVGLGCAWRSRDEGAPYLAKLIDDGVLLAIAATTVAILVGGWGSGTSQGPLRLARGLQFVTFSFGLWLFLRRARHLAQSLRVSLGLGAGLVTVVAVGTAALIALEPTPALVVGIARVVGGAAALLLVNALSRLASGRLQTRAKPLHRFA